MTELHRVTDGAVAAHLTWMRLRGLSAASITQRRRTLARLQAALRVPLMDATAEDLSEWQEKLRAAPASLANYVANVACFYRWAYDHKHLNENPAAVLVRPKVPRGVPRPMGEERLRRAIDSAEPDVRCWIILGAYAGMRVGEMSRLDRQDVMETAEPPVLYLRGKGAKIRVVPASSRVIAELLRYGLPSRGPVFRRRDGGVGAPSPARISQLVNGHLHEHGITDTAHATRHRYATRMYALSKDLRLVQEMLGHADVSTAAGYCAYGADEAASFVEQLDPPDPPPQRLRSAS